MDNNEIEFKSYDPKIMRRLLGYAKPYMGVIFFCIFLLLIATAIQLSRPILLGKAIDDVIGNSNPGYLVTEAGDIEVKGYSLKPVERKEEKNEGTYATLLYQDKKYYLVAGLSASELATFRETKALNEDNLFKGQLSKDEIMSLRKRDFTELIQIVGLYLLLIIIGLALSYYQGVLLQKTGQRIIYNIRNEVFAHIEGRSIHYFNNHPVGTLVTRVTNDTETLNEMYTSVIANSVKNIFLLVGVVVMMIGLSPALSFRVLMIVPVIIFITFVYKKFSRENFRIVRTRVAKVNAFLSEHIQGMKIIQIFAMEDQVYNHFERINKKHYKYSMRSIMLFGVYKPLMYALYVTGICIVLFSGGNMVLDGVLTIGALVIFLQYNTRFFQPIQELAEQFNILQSAMASAEKIFKVLDTEDEIKNKEKPAILDKTEGNIEFKNVWFAYEDEEYVLRDVSFKVNKGETVAFVGATGAGKTSILNLISRYYDIQKGEILIDGVNVKDYDKKSIRDHVGQMLQDVFLFTGNIKSNIRLRNEDITDEEIIQAAKYVNAHPFIEKLPDQYDEQVYERGATFSAGQRQLLSFARTLVSDPSILILDEATANIDTETEQLIQDALEKLMEGRTTLVVAHRLSTIQHADKIIVLHKGKIREMGNHQELLAKKGMYYKLYQLQYQDQA